MLASFVQLRVAPVPLARLCPCYPALAEGQTDKHGLSVHAHLRAPGGTGSKSLPLASEGVAQAAIERPRHGELPCVPATRNRAAEA